MNNIINNITRGGVKTIVNNLENPILLVFDIIIIIIIIIKFAEDSL